jgi:DNA-binding MarR family transcriptional regulator
MAAWPSESRVSARPDDGTDGADGVDGAEAVPVATGVLGSEPMSVTVGARPQRARSGTDDELETRLIATGPVVWRHLGAHARRRRAWKTLTYQQYNVLRIIHGEGALPPGEIARRLMVTAPVVTRLASGLVEAGLVEKGRDAADKRTVLLSLTAAGRRQATAMRRDLLTAAKELIEPLPARRRAAVAKALDELQVLLPSRPNQR